MAYNIIPKNLNELLDVHKDAHELVKLYLHIKDNYKIDDPFSFDKSNFKNVKIVRALQDSLDLKKFKTSYKLDWGNGSRGSGGSNNKGLLYERDLFEDLQNYLSAGFDGVKKNTEAIKDIVNLIPSGFHMDKVIMEGEKNQKRPLKISSTSITTGTKSSGGWNIGSTVTDITVVCKDKNKKEHKLFLSLKMGSTVTFVNAGVTKYLQESEMKKGLIKNSQGKELLELFQIDNAKFCSIFNNYTGKGTGKETVNITSKLKSSSLFKEFMRSVIGYGYVLVHKIGSKTYIIDMTKQIMENMISVNNAYILYPKDGSAKRIDVVIEMNEIVIKINIRNKQGKLYPSHIMADYVMEH